MHFTSTDAYVATGDLIVAVNAAVTLERPLLVRGEPGTGQTERAREVARSHSAPLIERHIKSKTRARQGLYEYDAVRRLRDSQLDDQWVHDIASYLSHGKLWQAFEALERTVLLVDEIDKADIEFLNDLLHEVDRMELHVYETGESVRARHRPFVLITSNNKKDLPGCFFHYIRLQDEAPIRAIVEVRFLGINDSPLTTALTQFYGLRETSGLKKKPSASEVLAWLKLLLAKDLTAEDLRDKHEAAAASRGIPEQRTRRAALRAAGVHDTARAIA